MHRVRIVHWNADEARERARRLRAAGFAAEAEPPSGVSFFRELADDPPAALLIDLSRLPSQGRDLAIAVRARPATRHIPLVFVDGERGKVAAIRRLLPDATFAVWSGIRGAVKRAIAHPPPSPMATRSVFAAYAGRPLAQKLGVRPGGVLGLLGAPPGFRRALGELPANARVRNPARGSCDVILWFVRSSRDLGRRLPRMAARLERGSLWIAWPKKGSGQATDLLQPSVRAAGLAAGLVDYRICSIDDTWSGLRFARRRSGSLLRPSRSYGSARPGVRRSGASSRSRGVPR